MKFNLYFSLALFITFWTGCFEINRSGSSSEIIEEDWPGLSHFREANEKLEQPGENESRVVFMGNSITEYWKNESPDFFKNNSFINRAIRGQTSPQMLLRFRADVIDLNPEIVVILSGTNDIAGNTGPSTLKMIKDNISSMVELAEANGITVILSTLLPAHDFPWKPGVEPAGKIKSVNDWIRNYADSNNITFVDYFSSMADENYAMKSQYSDDGVHPNQKGYKLMESLLEEAIAGAKLSE